MPSATRVYAEVVSQVYRCSYEGVVAGVSVVNTFHVVADQSTGETGPSSADSVRDALHSALTTKYRALLSPDITVQLLKVREELDPGSSSVPAESSQTIGLAGTSGAASPRLPVPACIVAAFKTNAAVRGAQGRMFIPVHDPGVFTSTGAVVTSGAFRTAWAAFLDELKTSHHITGTLGGWDVKQVVYSRTRRKRGASEYYFTVSAWIIRGGGHWLESRQTAP